MHRLEARAADPDDPAIDSELQRVRTALQWCRAGVYGRCSVCGIQLPDRVLQQDPADMRCTGCRQLHAQDGVARPQPPAMPLLSLADGAERLNESFVRMSMLARDPRPD